MVRDVSAKEAWKALEENPAAQLIDVRTDAEWLFVGIPDLAGLERDFHLLSWQYSDGRVNGQFVEELRDAGIDAGQPLYFICRSGARSRSAAEEAERAGLGPVFNVAGGFEGPLDEHAHRGTVSGWKAEGLAWQQS